MLPLGLFWRHFNTLVRVLANISIRPSLPRVAVSPSWTSLPPPRSSQLPQLPLTVAARMAHTPPPPSLTNTHRLPSASCAAVGEPTSDGSPPNWMFGLLRLVQLVGQEPSVFWRIVMMWWSFCRRAKTWSRPPSLLMTERPPVTGPPEFGIASGAAQLPSAFCHTVFTTPLRMTNACGRPSDRFPAHCVPFGHRLCW